MKQNKQLALGIDIGSTTAKVVLADGDTILYECYERHLSQVRTKALEILTRLKPLTHEATLKVAIAGSAGLAQGRRITGKVMFLGGPLSFNEGLRPSANKSNKRTNGIFRSFSLFCYEAHSCRYRLAVQA